MGVVGVVLWWWSTPAATTYACDPPRRPLQDQHCPALPPTTTTTASKPSKPTLAASAPSRPLALLHRLHRPSTAPWPPIRPRLHLTRPSAGGTRAHQPPIGTRASRWRSTSHAASDTVAPVRLHASTSSSSRNALALVCQRPAASSPSAQCGGGQRTGRRSTAHAASVFAICPDWEFRTIQPYSTSRSRAVFGNAQGIPPGSVTWPADATEPFRRYLRRAVAASATLSGVGAGLH